MNQSPVYTGPTLSHPTQYEGIYSDGCALGCDTKWLQKVMGQKLQNGDLIRVRGTTVEVLREPPPEQLSLPTMQEVA